MLICGDCAGTACGHARASTYNAMKPAFLGYAASLTGIPLRWPCAPCMLREPGGQLRCNPRRNLAPVSPFGLSEYLRRGIPRRIFALRQPLPRALEAVEHPDRLSHGARKVSDRGIDADDEIELLDERSGLQEVFATVHPVEDTRAAPVRHVRFFALLKAHEARFHAPERRTQTGEPDVAPRRSGEPSGRPHKAYPGTG